jgi:DNA-binding response OmpR family regulator
MEPMREAEVLRAGDLEVRPEDHLALVRGRTLPLSVRELDLLAALLRRQGRIVPREELYTTVWGSQLRSSDRSVDVYIHKLRAKLARVQPEYRYVHTHFGFGYRLAPELSHPFHTDVNQRQQDGMQ